jgi:predicted TIM-barrel fold metal-dependent hydrolase
LRREKLLTYNLKEIRRVIDIHMHVGKLFFERAITPSRLLRFMDRNGIEKAVLLPIENPEETYYYVTTDYVLKVCKRHPDRFIPFCNVDPRRGNSDTSTDFYRILKEYKDRGCKGFGEAISSLYIDDPRLQKIYEACGELGFPIIFHLDGLRNVDEKGLPRFENMIKEFPETIFIGHAQHFWAEISSEVKKTDFNGCPKGKIKRGGAVEKLLSKYPNAYADLSAASGFNAISRDPEFGYRFLEKFQDKLLFGTDICHIGQVVQLVPYLKKSLEEGKISRIAYGKITQKNAERILKKRSPGKIGKILKRGRLL